MDIFDFYSSMFYITSVHFLLHQLSIMFCVMLESRHIAFKKKLFIHLKVINDLFELTCSENQVLGPSFKISIRNLKYCSLLIH